MTDLHSGPGPERPSERAAGAVKEEGSQVTSTAAEQGRQTASAAAEAGSQVAEAGVEGVRQVASEAASQAGQVTRQATDQARDLAQQAQTQIRDQAGNQTKRAASGLRDVSQQVRALSDGRGEEAGIAADAARQLAEKIEQLAGRIDERGFEGTVEDLRGFARRRPGLFLLGAAVAGFAATRLGRGLQVAGQAQPASPSADGSGPRDVPTSATAAAFPADTLVGPAPESTMPPPSGQDAPVIGGW